MKCVTRISILAMFVMTSLVEGRRIKRSYATDFEWWRRFMMRYPSHPYSLQYVYPWAKSHPVTTPSTTTATTTTAAPTTRATTTTRSTTQPPLRTTTLPVDSPSTTVFPTLVTSGSEVLSNETDILEKCSTLRTKTLRDACARVALNPILKRMDGVRGYIGEEEMDQPPLIITRGFSFLRPMLGKQIVCDEPEVCPDYTMNNRNRDKNLMSLSPWIMCQEYDPNRFPQWLNTARCLCKGCINSSTGREDGGDVVSQPLSVDISVLRKDSLGRTFRECNRKICREVVERVAIGCHCALAQIHNLT